MQSAETIDQTKIATLKIEQTHIISLLRNKNESLDKRINRLGQIIEDRFLMNDTSLASEGILIYNINQISTQIESYLTRLGLKIAPWAHDYLPTKWKDPSKIHNNSTDNRAVTPRKLDQLIGLSNSERDIINELENIATGDLDPLYVAMKKFISKMESVATSRNILLTGHEKKEDIRTRKQAPRITQLHEAIHWLRTGPLAEFEDFVKEYPPPKEFEQKWATGMVEWGLLYKSIINVKSSLTLSQWISRIKYLIHQSKHGAAVLDLVETMVCDNCWDEKLGREKDDCNAEMMWDWSSPTHWRCGTCGGTKGRKRGLTREQCGDNKAPTLTRAEELVNNLPGIYECMDFYITDPQKRIYARKIRLAQVLSKKA